MKLIKLGELVATFHRKRGLLWVLKGNVWRLSGDKGSLFFLM